MPRLINLKTRELLSRVEIPEPWDAITFVQAAAARHGRIVRVQSRVAVGDSITGTVFRLGAVDVIFYREDLEGGHLDHVLCHELAHILAGHLDIDLSAYQPDRDILPAAGHILNRSCQYGDAREREAEEFAAGVLTRVRQRVLGAPHRHQRAARGLAAGLR